MQWANNEILIVQSLKVRGCRVFLQNCTMRWWSALKLPDKYGLWVQILTHVLSAYRLLSKCFKTTYTCMMRESLEVETLHVRLKLMIRTRQEFEDVGRATFHDTSFYKPGVLDTGYKYKISSLRQTPDKTLFAVHLTRQSLQYVLRT